MENAYIPAFSGIACEYLVDMMDDNVLWGLAGLLFLTVIGTQYVDMWTPSFFLVLLILVVWVGKDWFAG